MRVKLTGGKPSTGKSGVGEDELRKIFGVSERTIQRWLEEVKKEEREKLKRQAIELKRQGKSSRQIAEELGVSHQTVINWIEEEVSKKRQDGKNLTATSPTEEEEEEEYTLTYSYADEEEGGGEEEEESENSYPYEDGDELEKYRQAYGRVFGNKEKETKEKLDRLKEYYEKMRDLALKVVREYGRDKAVEVLERVLEEIRHEM